MPPILAALRLFRERAREDRCFQLAGSLAFTSLLALVPLATVALSALSAFPAFHALTVPVRGFLLNHLVPASGGRLVSVYTEQFVNNAARLTAAGLALLALSAVLMMLTLDTAFDRIWRVRRSRSLASRLLLHWSALTLGPLLMGASLSLTSWLLGRSLSLGTAAAQPTLLRVAPALLTCLALALLYWAVPNRRVRAGDALLGGVVAGLGFEVMKVGLGAYVLMVPTYKIVYGAFASVPVFLLWVYLSWLVVIYGAELTALLPQLRSGGARRAPGPGTDFTDALALLWQLRQARRGGPQPGVAALALALDLDRETVERLLAVLEAQGWTARAADGAVLLARDPEVIAVARVHAAFGLDPRDLPAAAVPGLAPLLAHLGSVVEGELGLSLAAMWAQGATSPGAAAEGIMQP